MTPGTGRALTGSVARSSVGQLAFLVATGGLIALARRYLDLSIGVPGHTGVLWMFLLIYARGRAEQPLAGAVTGASAALWGGALGFKETLPYNLLLYSTVGAVADAVAFLPGLRLSTPLGGLLAGTVAHAAKYGFILVHATALGLSKRFLLVGVLESFGYHLAFGAIGGLAAGLTLWAVRRRRGPGRQASRQ